jgi:hypothetical protein
MFILYTAPTCISSGIIVPLLISYNPNDWAAPHFLSVSFGTEPRILVLINGYVIPQAVYHAIHPLRTGHNRRSFQSQVLISPEREGLSVIHRLMGSIF